MPTRRRFAVSRVAPNPDHIALAERRILSILRRHAIATARTLEMKIADAGPANQRMEPHIISTARRNLQRASAVDVYHPPGGVPWYSTPDTPPDVLESRYSLQAAVHAAVNAADVHRRVGQALELAIYGALRGQDFPYFGRYPTFDPDDPHAELSYKKEEHPDYVGNRSLPDGQHLDFLYCHPSDGWAAIEAKNLREWLYPDRPEIKDLIRKAVLLDCVPVLVARRFPYVTFKLLSTCGVIVHQTYNQLYHLADEALADRARDKRLLGYHDIRVQATPDSRLTKFISGNLPLVLGEARERFDQFADLLHAFAEGDMDYEEFAARVRRRATGEDEDADWEEGY